jgi:S-DNA-T family DNA segregation ATPase FtsK/SpoIIIE
MNQLERAGIVGRQEGSKPRDLKVTDIYSLERILQDLGLS